MQIASASLAVRQGRFAAAARATAEGGRAFAALLLAGAIFWVDCGSRVPGAVATLYVLVLLLADRGGEARLLAASAGSALLTCLSFLVTHGGDPDAGAVVRLLVCLCVNAVVTALLLHRHASVRRAGRRARHCERKRDEARARESRAALERVERTAAIGAMSASIAHEINQPLAAIQSYTQAAMRWIDRAEPDLREVGLCLQGLEAAVGNARMVVQRVRDLVGGAPAPEQVALSLPALVEETVGLAACEAAAAGIRLAVAPAGPVRVLGDPILLRHLLLNIITNAVQAMASCMGGERRIDLAMSADAAWVRLTVRDTGPGFPPAAGDMLFAAFYTTKPDGMGLGLSICRSIVERHGGTIALANHPEGGGVVTVALPRLEEPAPSSASASSCASSAASSGFSISATAG